ncbi:response regulator transcription factor [Arthrobacter sp. NPDC089319]|uniref:response regulator transcription factor n=1 Tax=Arthrobacter sp. NPDC089319 TaxID=3155915 RepID=UPI00342621D3
MSSLGIEHVLRVAVVDDHTTFAELLSDALGREPDLVNVGNAGGVNDAVALCLRSRPDVVIMDYHLPDGDGLEAAEQILADAPDTRIILLTGNPSPDVLARAAGSGLCGFLPKDGSLSTLLETIRHAKSGSMVVYPAILSQKRRAHAAKPPGSPALTERERQVLALMAAGHDVRTNARTLGISQHTCRGYVKSILAKLGAHSQLEAVATAQRLELLGAGHER